MLEDIAILTGGKAIFKDLGVELENIQLTRPRPGQEGQDRRREHDDHRRRRRQEGRSRAACEMIRREIDKTDSEYDREKLQERLAKLAGGVAQIKVGGRDRDRDEGAQGALRRRPARDPGGHRGRHRPRRRRGAAPGPQGARQARSSRATRRMGVRVSASALEMPVPHDRRERRRGRHRRRQQHPQAARTRTTATTPTPASTATCARPASSTRSR